jgi:CheY-like chemotaxis protein
MQPAANILVVEDDFSIRETIAELLEGEGYSVTRAANGAEALERLRRTEETSLILLDLMMPVMDGWEFRSRQKSDPRLAGIPVVVLSADNALDQKVSSLGVDAWLSKPFEVERLLETIDRLC